VITVKRRTRRVNSGRRPPRHRRAAPRHVDLAGLGASFRGFTDLAGIKRIGSTVGSTHRGPSMALGVATCKGQPSSKQLDQCHDINLLNEYAGNRAEHPDNNSEIAGSDPVAFKQKPLFQDASHVGCLSVSKVNESPAVAGTQINRHGTSRCAADLIPRTPNQ
jgi:hypothetical protein